MSSPDSPDAPEPAVGTDDADLRAARRVVSLLAIAVVAVLVGVGLVLAGSRSDDDSTIAVPDRVGDGGGDTAVSTAAIGPFDGDDVVAYVERRRAALRGVEGRRVAVVSLTGYSTEETVADLLEGLELDSYLVAMVGDEPRRTDDVDATRDDVVAEAEVQLPELEGIAPTVEGDEEFSSFYESEILRYRALLDAADRDDVVFGMVVVGPASTLRSLASRASVRLVDVGGTADLADDATVSGLRPEEVAVAGDPPFRP